MTAFRALRHRDYRIYFSGQLVSMVGTWMQQIAQAWLVHRLTGDARWLGLVAFAAQMPTFLLSLPAGVVADRVRSRPLLLVCQGLLLLQALALALLARQPHPSVPALVGLAAVLGIIVAFDLPARQVLVAQLVPREDLPNALALNSALFHGSRIVGPSLAGLAITLSGEASCFALNALSYVAALAALLAMRASIAPARIRKAPFREFQEGLQHLWQAARLRHVIGFAGLVVMLGMPFTALMPLIAKESLGVGPRELGWLMGVSGVGATLAALFLAHLKDTRKLPGILVGAVCLFSLFLAAFAQSHRLALAVPFLAATSFCLVLYNTGSTTLIQMLCPEHLRGRLSALSNMVFIGAMPTGALVAGFAARHLGIALTLTLGAAGCLVAALCFRALFKSTDPDALATK